MNIVVKNRCYMLGMIQNLLTLWFVLCEAHEILMLYCFSSFLYIFRVL